MQTQTLYGMEVARIGLGCMRYADKPVSQIVEIIETAHELGMNFFDHADIYGGGGAEKIFGEALAQSSVKREDVILQSKCGIRQGIYDFDKDYILGQVDQSLAHLKTDYMDIYLLHRPDQLMELDEVAEAARELQASGKVRHFGVSNFSPMQIELLQSALDTRIEVNQVQISLEHSLLFDEELSYNLKGTTHHTGGLISYARLKGLTLQAWSPLQYGFIEGDFITNTQHEALAQLMKKLGDTYDATPAAIALAWLLRHPANIQPMLGSTTPSRIREAAHATEFELTKREWYDLYKAAGNELP